MDQYHRGKNKKVSSGTGGSKRKSRDKKLAHVGGTFASVRVGESKEKKVKRMRGGSRRVVPRKIDLINVLSEGKMQRVKILGVVESHDPNYARMNIITKGAILNTDLGKVKVTNRVGQDGVVNGIKL
ncbi:30S ribosomal protein S8e [Candidatus Micrarchaeota archaeon]|nr:30S ribosomal protein S8e [Candidatus Micrarchaeota archaeon]